MNNRPLRQEDSNRFKLRVSELRSESRKVVIEKLKHKNQERDDLTAIMLGVIIMMSERSDGKPVDPTEPEVP